MTPKPTPSPADRLRGDLASGIVKVVSSNDLFALIGPMRGLSADTAEQRVCQLVREAWNKLPSTCEPASALLSDHARLVEENGRLGEALRVMVAALDAYPPDDPETSDWPSDPLGVLDEAIRNDFPALARAALSPRQKEGGGNG